jgi:hypothetical protein
VETPEATTLQVSTALATGVSMVSVRQAQAMIHAQN